MVEEALEEALAAFQTLIGTVKSYTWRVRLWNGAKTFQTLIGTVKR